MDNQNDNVEGKTVSALQVDELFLRKILTRKSSIENSAAVPYRRSVGEVPFRWESQPGTPRHHQLVARNDEIVPPIRPPPASSWHGQELDKPWSRETRAWFWKKSKSVFQGYNKKAKGKSQGNFHHDDNQFDYYKSFSTNSRSSSSSSRKWSLGKVIAKWAHF
ncbi:hypothetical protein COLO4_28647 [Corchorus olitorius]|uniref:Uncharacterized protein n=1 Tax=Corchorus olitorius TaxID=93759 RepID=A0A1R3HJ38_9ROSI|nr:hypothetical protein COLO4_28647 [Corchorus olitorius]